MCLGIIRDSRVFLGVSGDVMGDGSRGMWRFVGLYSEALSRLTYTHVERLSWEVVLVVPWVTS